VSGDDLHNRAREAAKGFVVPAEWGTAVDLEVGNFFDGRFRGHSDEGRSGAWLVWDEAAAFRFFWGCARLDQGFAEVPIGATISVYRDENYTTRFDDEGEASGLSYGVSSEPCSDPLPGSDEPRDDKQEDDIPF
jgi:hypothetical protein